VEEARRSAQPELYALVELAKTAKPEFGAWAILKILDSGQIPDGAWKKDLAEDALRLARLSTHSHPLSLATGFTPADNRVTRWHQAYAHGLDALSLSARAVQHLHRLDPRSARQAFQALPPRPATLFDCTHVLLPDRSAWYRTAAHLSLSAEDINASLRGIQWHTEIPPAIDMLFERRSSEQEWELFAGALADTLRTLPVNGRQWSSTALETGRRVQQLLTVLATRNLPVAPLREGWRVWTQNALSSPACADSQPSVRQSAWELFNASPGGPALPPELLKPAEAFEGADLGSFVGKRDMAEQAAAFYKLLFGSSGRALSDSEKGTAEWREQFQTYIGRLEARTRSSTEESVSDFFLHRVQDWNSVLMVAPSGGDRDSVLKRYIAFLLANAEVIDPLLLFAELDAVTVRTQSLFGADFAKVLSALDQSGHPSLRLYARVRQRFPYSPAELH
jgi:hypothetical protein